MRACLRLSLLLSLPLLALGCGKTHYEAAPVSGRVTMDNRPLAGAEVLFTPTGGEKLPYSIGITDDQGNYQLHVGQDFNTPGAVLGEHRVSISFNTRDKSKAKMLMDSGGRMPQRPGELVPGKYNRDSKLTCIVPAGGKTDANFDLKSK